jgi:hypothetical protein
MTLQQLHTELTKLKISEESYYLHGLYGSTDDNDKLALTIKRGKYFNEYEVYFKERGQINSLRTFSSEEEACKYFLDKKIYELKLMNDLRR